MVVVHDVDDCYEHHVHLDLACSGGDVGDEGVPDERVAERTLASDQGHHSGHFAEPLRLPESRGVAMAFLLDSVMRRFPLAVRLHHRKLGGCTGARWDQTLYVLFPSSD